MRRIAGLLPRQLTTHLPGGLAAPGVAGPTATAVLAVPFTPQPTPATRASGVLNAVGATSSQVGRSAGHALSVVLSPARRVLPGSPHLRAAVDPVATLQLPLDHSVVRQRRSASAPQVPVEAKDMRVAETVSPGLSEADQELLRMVQAELREVARLVGNRRLRRRIVVATDCLTGVGREVRGSTLILIPSREQASIARLQRAHRKADDQRALPRHWSASINPLRVPSYLAGAIRKI